MTINDLLAPNETIRKSGTVHLATDKTTNITLTNQCIYLHCENDYEWTIIRYEYISLLSMRIYGGKLQIYIRTSGYNVEFTIGQNYKWAEDIYRCIKNCWDEAKSGNSGGIASARNITDNPFAF